MAGPDTGPPVRGLLGELVSMSPLSVGVGLSAGAKRCLSGLSLGFLGGLLGLGPGLVLLMPLLGLGLLGFPLFP